MLFTEIDQARAAPLLAGAGLDGLQHVCKVGVFAELDYSPGIHTQCVGRYWRDGQDETSLAYFLLSESGSDPEIASILGLKRSQSEGIEDPDASLIEDNAVEPGAIKKLAQSYLLRLGIQLPTEEPETAELL